MLWAKQYTYKIETIENIYSVQIQRYVNDYNFVPIENTY